MPAQTPEQLFLDYLDRRERGEAIDFEAVCAAHPDRAHELRSLHRIWHFATAARTSAPAGATTPPENPQLLEILKTRGGSTPRYRVDGEVARGGMGVILRVFDQDLRRDLAMKVLPEDAHARPAWLARFLDEAQVTGQLDHPGIVPVHEVGIDAENRVFFTMKLVKGIVLEDVFRAVATGADGWSVTRALSVVLRVCEAMAFAHEKGVIHRDLKPSNVMVGKFGETYVMDWGVARVLDRPETGAAPDAIPARNSPLLTLAGDTIGTLAYMPPEQARGELDRIGPRSDVYAVGAILYHLLTGRAPYEEPDAVPPARVTLAKVLHGPPPAIHELTKDVPAALQAICEKAMARELELRYATMTALADDLRAYLERRVVKAYETGAWAELKKWVSRNRRLAAAAAVAILALAGIGVVQSLRKAEVESEKSRVAARKAEFDQLAGKVYLERALAAEKQLYPAWPERITALELWLAQDWHRLAQLQPTLVKTIADLEARATPATDAESESQRFLHETLTDLAADIGALERGEKAAVERRLAWARQIDQLTRHHPRAAVTWEQARAAIAAADGVVASTLYRDPPLDLVPQTGLVPIGMNPATKLWEFYELESACDRAAGEDAAAIEIPKHREDGSIEVKDGTGIVFVLIPGGEFRQGAQRQDEWQPNFDPEADPDEAPQDVTLAPFFLARHELTKGQWQRLTGGEPSWYQRGSTYDGDPAPIGWTHPVEQVSWTECELRLARAGLALPTEAQWERAARAGGATPWWTGLDAASLAGATNVLDERAEAKNPGWGRQVGDFDDGFIAPAPVASFRANAFGLFDVHGNVWEWCADGYQRRYAIAREGDGMREQDADAEGPVIRIARGGAFNNPAKLARSASRDRLDPATAHVALGVRAARTVVSDR